MVASGLRLVTERSGDGAGEPILDSENGEELMHVQPEVSIVLGNRPLESTGTLHITNRQVVWLSDADRQKGYAVDFLSVTLHAVSRDPEAFPSPCIYTQIAVGESRRTPLVPRIFTSVGIDQGNKDLICILEWAQDIESGHEDDDSDGSDTELNGVLDLSKITEMRLVPSDPTQLDTLFDVFCECAELNPEPIGEEEEEHNWIFSADQLDVEENEEPEWISHDPGNLIGVSNGDHDLAHTVLQLQINDQRFEDAEEMESDSSSGHH